MLVALFTLSMKAILQTGTRADERADAEMARLQNQLLMEREDHAREMIEAKAETKVWHDRYVAVMESPGRERRRSPRDDTDVDTG